MSKKTKSDEKEGIHIEDRADGGPHYADMTKEEQAAIDVKLNFDEDHSQLNPPAAKRRPKTMSKKTMSKKTKSDEGRGASVEGQEKTRPDNSEPGTFIGGFMPESPAVKRLCRLAEVAAEVERGLVNLGEMIDGQGGMAIVALTHQVHDHPAVAHARGTAEVWKAVAYNPDEEAK